MLLYKCIYIEFVNEFTGIRIKVSELAVAPPNIVMFPVMYRTACQEKNAIE